MVVAILVFTFIPRENLAWLVLSRIVLIPVIAAISYEIIRFSGAHQAHPLTKLISYPGLLLQSLTTRSPSDDQIEVAIHAMETAVAADEGRLPALPAFQQGPEAHLSSPSEAGQMEGGEVVS
jgi:uncharacterized protein YqhQ